MHNPHNTKITAVKNHIFGQMKFINVFVCFLTHISLVNFPVASAEIDVWWGVNLSGLFMVSCAGNIRTRNYQNLITHLQVTIGNVGVPF